MQIHLPLRSYLPPLRPRGQHQSLARTKMRATGLWKTKREPWPYSLRSSSSGSGTRFARPRPRPTGQVQKETQREQTRRGGTLSALTLTSTLNSPSDPSSRSQTTGAARASSNSRSAPRPFPTILAGAIAKQIGHFQQPQIWHWHWRPNPSRSRPCGIGNGYSRPPSPLPPPLQAQTRPNPDYSLPSSGITNGYDCSSQTQKRPTSQVPGPIRIPIPRSIHNQTSPSDSSQQPLRARAPVRVPAPGPSF